MSSPPVAGASGSSHCDFLVRRFTKKYSLYCSVGLLVGGYKGVQETDHSRQLSSLEGHEEEEGLSCVSFGGWLHAETDARFGGMSAMLSVPF